MPMHIKPVGKDSDGKDIVEVWGDTLNWAHGTVKTPGKEREYYRAQGRGDANYAVMRDLTERYDECGVPVYRYWYVVMYVDGQTTPLPTEFMTAWEGQEVCQIFEAERGVTISSEVKAKRLTKGE